MNTEAKRLTAAIAVLVALLSSPPQSAVAAAGDENWDGTFGVPGANSLVFAIAAAGTNVYFGGAFTSIGGIAAANIARWDGARWSPLGTGTDGIVFAMAVRGSELYVGGVFSQAGGVPANHVAKWDGNTWSALGEGFPDRVFALA